MTTPRPRARNRLELQNGEIFLRIGSQLITIDWNINRADACGICWHAYASHYNEPHTTRCEHYVENTRAGVCPCPGFKEADPVTRGELIDIARTIARYILETKGQSEMKPWTLRILADEALISWDISFDLEDALTYRKGDVPVTTPLDNP